MKRIEAGPQLFVGILSKHVYFAKRVTAEPHDDGTATFFVVGNKIDVTESFEKCARELGWHAPQEGGKPITLYEKEES